MDRVKISSAAVNAWIRVIVQFWQEYDIVRSVVIPTIAYKAGKSSDEGNWSHHCRPLMLNEFNTEELLREIQNNLDAIEGMYSNFDYALNRNIMLLHYKTAPTLVTLDIIDTDPASSYTEIKCFNDKYTILKTDKGFHLYANRNVTRGLESNGYIIQDPNWNLGYIRVTESNVKGPIVSL